MNKKKAKKLRNMARMIAASANLPERAYNLPDVDGIITLAPCTRRIYKQLKREFYQGGILSGK
jgi:hypothetical protein